MEIQAQGACASIYQLQQQVFCKWPKNHSLAAVVCNRRVEVETVALRSAKRNSLEASMGCVIVQYEDNRIIFS